MFTHYEDTKGTSPIGWLGVTQGHR